MAEIETIKIAGTGTAATTTNSVAQIDVPDDGEIIAIVGEISGAVMADEDLVQGELSFLATNQLDVNDARGSLMQISLRTATLTTSGQANATINQSVSLAQGITVFGGERIHVHTFGSTGVTPTAMFLIYIKLRRASRRARRRT